MYIHVHCIITACSLGVTATWENLNTKIPFILYIVGMDKNNLLLTYCFSGKRVFKKPVKFLIKMDPARTAGDRGDNDPNDGKTFVVTFVQTNGKRDSAIPPTAIHAYTVLPLV